MNMNKSLQLKKPGSALAMVLIALVVLLLMGTGLLSLGLRSRIFAVRTASRITARCAADAGFTKAVFEMNEKLKAQYWTDNVLPQVADETLPNCGATFSYAVTGDSDSGYVIESVGKSVQAERKVNGTLKLQGLFEYAIFTLGSIELKNGTTVDWYNYDVDDENLQIGTNSTAGGSVIMKTGVTINGDVVVGLGGDPDVVINSKNEVVITGDTPVLTEERQLPLITVPQYLQLLPSQGTITDSTTIIASAKYDGINLDNSKIITIDGAVELYILGDVILDNSAQIQIVDANTNPDASLTLYLGGNLVTKNGGTINNLTGDPARLKVYGLDGCTSIDFATASTFYGAIYAPNADVRLSNSVEFFGALVADSFVQSVFADFHYDASLRDVTVNDEGVRFVVKRWYE